jgi:hypothetical protein
VAAGLNVIPIGSVQNTYAQQYAQALRNLQVGRNAYVAALDVITRAVQAPGGSAVDLATLFGISQAQAQILHDESASFGLQLDDPTLTAAWDQLNAIMGIIA